MKAKQDKGKFIKNKGKTYFQDQNGNNWTNEQLTDLIQTLQQQRQTEIKLDYYKDIANRQ